MIVWTAYISEGWWIFPLAFKLEVQMFLKNCCRQPLILSSSPNQLYLAATNSDLPVKTAWDAIKSRGLNQPWAPLAWSSLMIPKISCFSWKLFHGRLSTSDWAKIRGISLASACLLCLKNTDNSPHFPFQCSIAIDVWKLVLSMGRLNLPPNPSATSLCTSLSYGAYAKTMKGIGAIFLSTCFSNWKARCTRFFSNIKLAPLQILNSVMVDISFSLKRIKGTSSSHILRSFYSSLNIQEWPFDLSFVSLCSSSSSLLFSNGLLLGLFGLYPFGDFFKPFYLMTFFCNLATKKKWRSIQLLSHHVDSHDIQDV